MSTAAYTPEMGERIAALLSEWKLPDGGRRAGATAGRRRTRTRPWRSIAEVAGARGRRAQGAARGSAAAGLEAATGQDLRDARQGAGPGTALLRVQELSRGDFVEQANNVLLFGLPGVGKSHLACALGHALVEAGRSVLFTPTYQLVQQLLAARRDLTLPRALRALDVFDAVILDDLGYVQQTAEEAEVLFTLMAERYERRSLIITSNLVFSEWDRIFKTPMATAAAIDRLSTMRPSSRSTARVCGRRRRRSATSRRRRGEDSA